MRLGGFESCQFSQDQYQLELCFLLVRKELVNVLADPFASLKISKAASQATQQLMFQL